jgi:hypothetical protein
MHYLSTLLLLHFVLNLFTQATPRSRGIDGKIATVRLLVYLFSVAARDWKLHPLPGCMASAARPRRGRTLCRGARSRTTPRLDKRNVDEHVEGALHPIRFHPSASPTLWSTSPLPLCISQEDIPF